MPPKALRTALSSTAFGAQNSSTTTLRSPSARSTRSGSPPAAAACFVSLPGAAAEAGSSADLAAATDGVEAVSPAPPASSSARASWAAVASLAFSTALPARLPAAGPPASTGRLDGAVGVAAAGVAASSLGRRKSIHAARNASVQTRRIRMGGEIWDIPLPLSAADRSCLSRNCAAGVRTRSDARRSGHLDAQLGQLRAIDGRRRAGQRIRPAGRLRERDHVADRVAPREQRDDPVEAEGEPAVRRRAEAQRVEQEAEARVRLLLGDPEHVEHLPLDLRPVDTDRPAADLHPVERDVVAARAQRARIGEVPGRRRE